MKKDTGLIKCYGPEQAEIHIKCNAFIKRFESMFPPPGVRGWYSMGVDFDRMRKVAEELEEREAKRGIVLGRN